jgi:hypothetical protein
MYGRDRIAPVYFLSAALSELLHLLTTRRNFSLRTAVSIGEHLFVGEAAAVRTRLILRPGQRGTKQLVAQYGDKLVCVRYRYDAQRRKRYKTVEVIVSEADWLPPLPTPDAVVAIRVAWGEADIGRAIKAAGGRWNRVRQVWELRYAQVVRLKLVDRIVPDEL